MKDIFPYSIFAKSVICLLVVGQLATAVLPYCIQLMNPELVETIELSEMDGEDKDSEEEKKEKEKEKEKRLEDLRPDLCIWDGGILASLAGLRHAEGFPLPHHPEILTPPPERPLPAACS